MIYAYIAAPLFSQAERSYNQKLCELLHEFVECYLPQRDGMLLAEALRGGGDRKTVAQMIFDMDITAIRRADLVIAVLDGSDIDAGVALEVGVSWALGKRVFGLRTDPRRPISAGLNPMIEGACHRIFMSTEDLVRGIASETTISAV